jgi:hypothetical protein
MVAGRMSLGSRRRHDDRTARAALLTGKGASLSSPRTCLVSRHLASCPSDAERFLASLNVILDHGLDGQLYLGLGCRSRRLGYDLRAPCLGPSQRCGDCGRAVQRVPPVPLVIGTGEASFDLAFPTIIFATHVPGPSVGTPVSQSFPAPAASYRRQIGVLVRREPSPLGGTVQSGGLLRLPITPDFPSGSLV